MEHVSTDAELIAASFAEPARFAELWYVVLLGAGVDAESLTKLDALSASGATLATVPLAHS